MASQFIEIERKFLVRAPWPQAARVRKIKQLYLDAGGAVSVRLRQSDEVFSLTLKSAIKQGMRNEFEIPVPLETGQALFALHQRPSDIQKQRHDVIIDQKVWEIDVFENNNAGLIVAEIELESEQGDFARPVWLGPEVTHDKRFSNYALSLNPFTHWGISYADLVASFAA
jgi:adenylate cyclase